MVTFNVKSTLGLYQVNVPEEWKEVTFKKYVELINYDDGSFKRRIAIMLGLPYDEVDFISAENMLQIYPTISFVFSPDELLKYNYVSDEYKDYYIGHQSWAKLEEAKKAIAMLDGKDSINAASSIVKTYTGIEIDDKPVTEVIGLANFFLSNYLSFMNVSLN